MHTVQEDSRETRGGDFDFPRFMGCGPDLDYICRACSYCMLKCFDIMKLLSFLSRKILNRQFMVKIKVRNSYNFKTFHVALPQKIEIIINCDQAY